MDKLLLKATERTDFGKNEMYRLRSEGKIPAVIYGKDAPVHAFLDEKDFMAKFRHISDKTIVPLEIGGKKIEILLKEYQYDMVRDRVLHVDLYELVRTAPVKFKVPVKVIGTAVGIREGGVLNIALKELEIECIARFKPNFIELPVAGLKLNDKLVLSTVKAPENVKFITKTDTVVASVDLPKVEVKATEE